MSLAAAAQPESRTLGLSVTAEGAHEIVGARSSYQYCRASTRLAVDGAHFLASLSSVPPGECPVDANPPLRETLWRRPIGRRSRNRLGRLSQRPSTPHVHLFVARHHPVLDFDGRARTICCAHR